MPPHPPDLTPIRKSVFRPDSSRRALRCFSAFSARTGHRAILVGSVVEKVSLELVGGTGARGTSSRRPHACMRGADAPVIVIGRFAGETDEPTLEDPPTRVTGARRATRGARGRGLTDHLADVASGVARGDARSISSQQGASSTRNVCGRHAVQRRGRKSVKMGGMRGRGGSVRHTRAGRGRACALETTGRDLDDCGVGVLWHALPTICVRKHATICVSQPALHLSVLSCHKQCCRARAPFKQTNLCSTLRVRPRVRHRAHRTARLLASPAHTLASTRRPPCPLSSTNTRTALRPAPAPAPSRAPCSHSAAHAPTPSRVPAGTALVTTPTTRARPGPARTITRAPSSSRPLRLGAIATGTSAPALAPADRKRTCRDARASPTSTAADVAPRAATWHIWARKGSLTSHRPPSWQNTGTPDTRR